MAKANRTIPGTPAAVKKQARKADKLHEEIYGKPGEEAPVEETPTEPVVAETPPAQDEPDPKSGADIQPVEAPDESQVPKSDTDEGPPPVQAEVTPVEPTPADPPPAADPSEWQTKYQVLQGKYNAEVPRLTAELRDLRTQISSLQTLVDASANAAPADPPPAPEKKSVVTPTDLEDYGEDLVNLITRVARNEAVEEAGSLIPKIDEVKGQVANSTKTQASNSVYAKLDSEVQDWRDVNKSAGFVSWLAMSDPYAGAVRSDLLTTAFENGDAERVTAFFKGYKAEQELLTPAPQPTPPAETPAPQAAPQVSLESLAGPAAGPSSGQVDTDASEPPSWSRDQIGAFYADVQRGVFANDPDKKSAIENSIAVALKAGRVH